MNCKCGGATIPHGHEVKTMRKATEWLATIEEADLPIWIDGDTCGGCGRMMATITSSTGKIVGRRG